jgi:hypothetical protein
MKFVKMATISAVIFCLLNNGVAYCDNGLSYDDTVSLIKKTMVSSPSEARKESYGSIAFNKCSLEYDVYGTYPVGDLYHLKFRNIDFSSLNYQVSKTGHDYTAFMALNFENYFQVRDGRKELAIRTVVINVSNDERADILFKAFLHLGDLCGAGRNPR